MSLSGYAADHFHDISLSLRRTPSLATSSMNAAAIPMTLGDLQGHLPTETLSKLYFSYRYICAVVDKISTHIARPRSLCDMQLNVSESNGSLLLL